ncbi:MAG: FMN-binding protein [Planctomycetota bacterium]|jgi:ferredoxin
MDKKWHERWLEVFAAKASRPWRLAAFTFLIALMFPGTRFFLIAVIFIVLVIKFVECGLKNRKWWPLKILIGIFLFACLMYAAAAAEAYRVAKYRRSLGAKFYLPPGSKILLKYMDGVFEGMADGARGPVKVRVEALGGGSGLWRIKSIEAKLDEYRETASIGGNALKSLNEKYRAGTSGIRVFNSNLEQMRLDHAVDSIDGITGATLTSRAYRKAVKTAIVSAQHDSKEFSAYSSVIYFFLRNEISKISFNTLAIIFILVVFFDYTLQGLLVRGTGQAVSCMNCQTCVGACPVKRVEIDGKVYAFPMDIVLYTRLGDYETVKKLSIFCVGCARCTGKCPIGISAPSVASAAIQYMRVHENAEKAKQEKSGTAAGGGHA